MAIVTPRPVKRGSARIRSGVGNGPYSFSASMGHERCTLDWNDASLRPSSENSRAR